MTKKPCVSQETWSLDDIDCVSTLIQMGYSVPYIAALMRRTPSEIQSKVADLGHAGRWIQPFEGPRSSSHQMLDGESLFVPLAISSMSDTAVCLAGIDPTNKQWVRIVQRGAHCLARDEVRGVSYGSLYAVRLGDFRARLQEDDPNQLHVEDRVMDGSPSVNGHHLLRP